MQIVEKDYESEVDEAVTRYMPRGWRWMQMLDVKSNCLKVIINVMFYDGAKAVEDGIRGDIDLEFDIRKQVRALVDCARKEIKPPDNKAVTVSAPPENEMDNPEVEVLESEIKEKIEASLSQEAGDKD